MKLLFRPLMLATLLPLVSAAWAQKQMPLERGKVLKDGIVACGNGHVAFTAKGPDCSKGLAWQRC